MNEKELEQLVRDAMAKAQETKEPEVETKEPEVKEPEVETKEPEVETKEPEVETKEPEVKEPEVETKEPEVKEPEVKVEVETKEPEVDINALIQAEIAKALALSNKEPEVEIKEPEVKVEVETKEPEVESGQNNASPHLPLGDTLKAIEEELHGEDASISAEQKALLEFMLLNYSKLENNLKTLLESTDS